MRDAFEGALLGLALADAVGAKYEGGLGARLLWAALGVGKGRTLRWTDDTLMARGLARSLTVCGGLDADHLAGTWAQDARWTRGYGRGARTLLQRVARGEDWRTASRSVFPEGSFGNGAAMRAAPLGLFFHDDPHQLVEAARLASSITHAHPLGIEGGVLVAAATAQALAGEVDLDSLSALCSSTDFRTRLEAVPRLLDTPATPREVREVLGNGIRAQASAVTALYAFLRYRDGAFEDLLSFVIALGGDTDTIGAMAGGMFGAHRTVAALPAELLERLEDEPGLRADASALYAAFCSRTRAG